MAGDWIKMRVDLHSHPKIVRILSATGSDKFRVIGGLHAVWSVFDAHSENGELKGYTPELMDHVIGWPGFSVAMVAVGWLLYDGIETLSMPGFDEHNGKSGKRRAEDQKRKRDARKQSEDCPKDCGQIADEKRTREEKRRIKKHIAPAKADGFVFKTELLNLGADPTLVDDWLAVRKTKKASNTRTALDAFMREVNRAGYTVDQALRICCAKSWKGFDAEWVKDIKPVETAPPIPFDREAYEAKRKAELAAARERYQREQEAIAVPVGVAK